MDVMTHIRTFVEVVRSDNFSAAARQLGVVPSVVAKRIRQLEEELGSRLFDRTTRKIILTDAGQRLYTRASPMVQDFDELLHVVSRDEKSLHGHLRVMAPLTLTCLHLGQVFNRFLLAHPHITLDLRLVDRSANPAELGCDLAISGRSASYEGVAELALGPVQPRLCAAPAYLAQYGSPLVPHDLLEHSCLVFSAAGNSWNFDTAQGVNCIEVRPRLQADDNLTLREAARSGMGIALLPDYVASDALRAGHLIQVLPDYTVQENWFKAYVPRRHAGVARVRVLLEYLQRHWPI